MHYVQKYSVKKNIRLTRFNFEFYVKLWLIYLKMTRIFMISIPVYMFLSSGSSPTSGNTAELLNLKKFLTGILHS